MNIHAARRGAVRAIGAAILVLSAAACLETTLPGNHAAPVHLQVSATLDRASSAAAGATPTRQVDLVVAYLRSAGAPVTLLTQHTSVDQGRQEITLTVDVTDCLQDAARAAGAGCPLTVAATLRDDAGAMVDSQTVGPLGAQPGATVTTPALTLREINSIAVSLGRDTLLLGDTLRAAATLKGNDAAPITGRPISWSSSNPAVASVAADGRVVGVAPGAVTITATSQGKSGSASLVVRVRPVASASVRLAKDTILAADTTSAAVTLRDDRGNVLTGRTTSWSSSDAAVATVGADGRVTAVAPGTATITATSEGSRGTATLVVRVVTLTESYAGCDPTRVPIWYAVQTGSGAWTRVTPGANNTFTVTMGARGGLARVTPDGAGFFTDVLYGSASDFLSLVTTSPCEDPSSRPLGTKRITGTVTNVGAPGQGFATVVIGGATATNLPGLPGSATPFTLIGVPSGPRDLVAARTVNNNANGTTVVQKLIVRRGTNYANNAAIPVLDFNGAEAFVPLTRFMTPNNLGSDQLTAVESLVTASSGAERFYSGAGAFNATQGVNAVPVFMLPDSVLRPSDLHRIQVVATSVANPTSLRAVDMLLHAAPAAQSTTVTLGPSLASPTVTTLAATPYQRLRAQLPSQSAYTSLISVDYFSDADRSVTIQTTPGYSGGVPASWTLDVPDLSSAGYDPTWGMQTGAQVRWAVGALGGNFLPFFLGQDNAQLVGASVTSPSTASTRLPPSGSVLRIRTP